jgi:phospholipid transport system substrate-binding protein
MLTRVPVSRLLSFVLSFACVTAAADAVAAPAAPASPTEAIRTHVDEVVSTVRSPHYKTLEPAQREETIRRISARLFDWPEMARRALGPHWADRSPGERSAFTASFSRLAERAYLRSLDRLERKALAREPIRFVGERVTGNHATVQAVLASPRDVPLEFRLFRRDGRWRVHDVAVEGVSAVDNYGAQFRRVIARGSYPTLAERIVAKVGEAPAAPLVASTGR